MKFTCNTCSQPLEAESDWAGTYIECSACKTRVRVPANEERTAPNLVSWIPALVFQSITAGFLLIVTLLQLSERYEGESEETITALFLIFLVPLILQTIFTMVLHYKCWKALPPEYARTTPGKAVGLLFVPFYNFYWVFPSVAGLAQDYRSWGVKTQTTAPGNQHGLGVALSVLWLCQWLLGWIPVLGGILGLASFVLWTLFYKQMTKYANLAGEGRAQTAAGAFVHVRSVSRLSDTMS